VDHGAIRAALDERLSELDRDLAELTAVPRAPAAAASFGKRIGDGTTEAVDRLTKVGAAEQLAVMQADVVRALEKLDDGTYGICDRCGAMIPQERLEARPWSVLCVRCASDRARERTTR
jgi:RNA polymerase-binding transcription factor DksA